MNIYNPKISRLLAQLIQPLAFEDRFKFIKDAEEAKDLKTFLSNYPNYKRK